MIRFLGKLWRDRRGNALIIAGAALPFVVGAAGLATHTIQWVVWKRELQRAADSAAFAGVYAKLQDSAVPAAVNGDLTNNNKTGITLASGYPQIAYPTVGTYSYAVQVTLRVQKTLGFSSLFMASAPTITASATAAMVDDGQYCLVALKKSGGAGISIGGSSSANLGCGGISNANSNPAVATNGASYNFIAPVVAGVGTLPSAITGVTSLRPHHSAMPDPFAGKYPTSTSGMTCNKQVTGGSTNLTPGCYKDFSFTGNKTYNLAAGTYFLDSTDFSVAGGVTVTGTGVTIILTGTTPGSIKTNGNSIVQLVAPTSGTYSKMLFIQASNATTDNTNEINGNNTSNYDGAMYFPKGNVTFTGSSGNMTKCAMVVAYTATFSGNTNLQNSTTGCSANQTVTNKIVKLVA
jgi:hypothetical protein